MTVENKDQGFIKVFRSMFDWEWWDDINTFRLFVTILMMANWKDKKWRGRKIKRGQLWTSLETLSERSGLTIRQVRVSLDKLILTGEVTNEVTNSGRLVTVENYDFYQDNPENVTNEMTSSAAGERQTNDKRVTTTKERKEYKELKNIVVSGGNSIKKFWEQLSPEDIDKVYEFYPNTGGILIDEVAKEVSHRPKDFRVENVVGYVLGYAKKVKWDDSSDHFEEA